MTKIEPIELSALRESPTNPRKSVKAESIAEMAETILSHGILQPLTVRPWPGEAGVFEIVFGHRRYLAAKEALRMAEERGAEARPAELRFVPVMVRDLTDAQTVEMQVIENLQREDVSARDEAEGYDRLLGLKDDQGGRLYTLETLADRIGKKKSYVSNRLRLRLAPAALWEAYEAGRVGTRHLELVGGIPHARTREEAAQRILKPAYDDQPMSVKEAEELIREHYRVSLRACGFDLEDAGLVQEEWKDGLRFGGACADCPHRTGNDPELAEGMSRMKKGTSGGSGIDPNLCCNPACFQAKQAVVWRKQKAAVENDGRRVLDVDATAELFSKYGPQELEWGTPYIDLGGRPGSRETGHFGGDDLPTWGELLQDTDAMKLSTVARHPHTKKLHFLLEWERAVELACENGHGKLFAQRAKKERGTGSSERGTRKAEGGAGTEDRRAAERKRRVLEATQRLMVKEIAVSAGESMRPAAGMVLAEIACRLACIDCTEQVLDFAGIAPDELESTNDDEIWEAVKARVVAGDWFETTVGLLAAAGSQMPFPHSMTDLEMGAAGRLAAELGLDFDEMEDSATTEVDKAERHAAMAELDALALKKARLKPRDKAGLAEIEAREAELKKLVGDDKGEARAAGAGAVGRKNGKTKGSGPG